MSQVRVQASLILAAALASGCAGRAARAPAATAPASPSSTAAVDRTEVPVETHVGATLEGPDGATPQLPTGTSTPPAIDFTTPVLSSPVFYSGPASCGPTAVTFDITTYVPGAQGMLIAYRLWDVARDLPTAWTIETMEPVGQGAFRRGMDAGRDIKGLDDVERGWMEYQFIATGADGQPLGRTRVYGDLAFARCGAGLPPLRLITPTPIVPR
ncbi:MAG TPA: hypothetical protein VLD63_04980 [Anaerolineales bacterium]|nr:hypothetical protein [Anaerolineales bacterium]